MELDEFKNLSKSGLSPDQMPVDIPQEPMDNLISELKEKDQERRKAIGIIMVFFVTMTVIYITSISRNQGMVRMGYLMLGGSFSILVAYFMTKFFRMQHIDYTAPVAMFLKDAEKRFRYWSVNDMIVSVPMLIAMCAGGALIVHGTFQKYFPGSFVPLIIFLLVFGAALGVGSWAGRRQWKKQYGSTYEKIVKLIREFEA